MACVRGCRHCPVLIPFTSHNTGQSTLLAARGIQLPRLFVSGTDDTQPLKIQSLIDPRHRSSACLRDNREGDLSQAFTGHPSDILSYCHVHTVQLSFERVLHSVITA